MAKFYFSVIIISIQFLTNACRNEKEGKGEPPLIFDKTEVEIGSEKKTLDFKCNYTNCFVGYLRDSIGWKLEEVASFYYQNGILQGEWVKYTGKDTLRYKTTHNKPEVIEGEWYIIIVNKNFVTVDILENKREEIRKLKIYMLAGAAGAILKITQNKK